MSLPLDGLARRMRRGQGAAAWGQEDPPPEHQPEPSRHVALADVDAARGYLERLGLPVGSGGGLRLRVASAVARRDHKALSTLRATTAADRRMIKAALRHVAGTKP